MDEQQFVDALKAHAADAAAQGTIEQWASPSGRFPSEARLAKAAWLNALSEHDRQMVHALVGDVARSTLFGVLCILDGSRSVGLPAGAHLELATIEGDRSTLLASSNLAAAPLHELL
jgi:hypothetical protein